MNYKAIFFDRDGTLTYFTAEKEAWRDKTISEWSGKKFELSYEKMMDLFHLASEGRKPWYKTLDDEREFFKRYYYHLLIAEGVTEDVENKAEFLLNEIWCNGDRALFSETVAVLEYFKNHGYKMGVISDTSPSLEFTLQQLGIAKYFTSFTASSFLDLRNLEVATSPMALVIFLVFSTDFILLFISISPAAPMITS